MNQRFREATLPNGKTVYCLREKEAELVYQQVRDYFKHGIQLEPGATVFDVGANIGLFTILVYELCHGEADVFAFEPIPAIREVLSANVRDLDSDRARVLPCGLGATAGSARFRFYPHHSTLSTAYSSAADENEIHEQLRESIVRNLQLAPPPLRWLRGLPPSLRSYVIRALTRRSFRRVEEVTCAIRTVSEVIREFDVERIDLLKVDVEKSELDVLQGIDAPDWQKVQQVVMEVHDLGGRLDSIVSLLRAHRIENVVAEQEPVLQGSNVYALYASRDRLSP
jgi:FkbM family methyltransferase